MLEICEDHASWPELSSARSKKLGAANLHKSEALQLPQGPELRISDKERVSRGLDYANSDCYLLNNSKIKLNIHALVFQLDEK